MSCDGTDYWQSLHSMALLPVILVLLEDACAHFKHRAFGCINSKASIEQHQALCAIKITSIDGILACMQTAIV